MKTKPNAQTKLIEKHLKKGKSITHIEALRLFGCFRLAAACESAKNRKLKRALWMARANRALEKIAWFKLWNASISTMNPEDGARQEYDKWKKNLGKFIKKAEEYK